MRHVYSKGASLRVVLATDSAEPSGVGEHMLTLAGEIAGSFDVVVSFPDNESGRSFLTRAARLGVGVHASGPEADEAKFGRFLESSGAHLLHLHAGIGWEGHGMARAGNATGLPVVRTEHLPFVLTDADQIAEYELTSASVDRVIAVSEASAETYRAGSLPERQIAVVRNGVARPRPGRSREETRLSLGLPEDASILLTVARFTAQKDHLTLVAAMPGVLAQHQNAVLLLVGQGPEQPSVEAAVRQARLDAQIRFLGRRADVADLMAAADLFVLPSVFEGLPLALLEAMSLGLPAVATRIGGIVEALGADHPWLVEPGDPGRLAATINEALAEPDMRMEVAAAGRRRFEEQHHASRMAAETASIYLDAARTAPERRNGMSRTRIGFIGAGGIAGRHMGVLESFDDVALVGFADPDSARAEEAARRYGARVAQDYRAMLDQGGIDAVYVCVPPFAHGEIEAELIRRDIPFFVEKPLSLDIGTAERIAAGIKDKGLITAVGYHWRYLDTIDEAKGLLARNPAQLLSGYWLDQTPPPQWWWRNDRSGGQMVEQTTHIIDLARYLVGDVDQVFGLAGHKQRGDFPDLDVATVSTAGLRFASGAVGNIASTCLLRWSHRIGLHIFADALAIEITDHDIMIDIGAGRPTRRAEGDPVWREDRDFIDAVRGGENRIRSPYGEALESHRVALAIAQSARTGMPVSISRPA